MSTSPQAQSNSTMDPVMDSMLDLSDYDNYQSPSLSPATSKTPFPKPTITTASTPTSLLSTSQPLTGPSHQYDLYKQQTGIVPGALASTLAVNQNNSQITGYTDFNLGFMGLNNTEDLFDFNTAPSQGSINADTEMDFDSPQSDPNFFFGESTVNPSSIGGQEPTTLPSPPVLSMPANNVGRIYPGMHSQAALAKAQAQQRQQQQMIQKRQPAQQQQAKPQRAKGVQPTDPIVEQKITQLLNSMRAKPASGADGQGDLPAHSHPRLRKDEDDMDDDEKLLASEEGKKLSSKERRQLRNKVSARAFRSRRKEYIGQLESEIANKVSENGDLRSQNRALVDENKRLTDLTRMLLSSPSFSDFLDRLSSNPAGALPQAPSQPAQAPPQQQQQQQQQSQDAQLPKDVNPYTAQQQLQQHQQIGMAMIPEQTMDFSMLSLDTVETGFTFQPQVYAVLETPETPVGIDTSVLSGKTSNFVGETFDSEDDKVEIPVIERPVAAKEEKTEVVAAVVHEEFENDPAFALYHESAAATPAFETTEKPAQLDTTRFSSVDIFGGIEPEKALARFELVDASEDDAAASFAMARVQRISQSMDEVLERLERLTVDL